ncbi:MAG: M20/M25/M40 family metallo-hydrolase [Planctomycetes bacterium]|nr:M20/M25/M40 family metallo-hydrolase [Planctomycetota bacterium]MCP4771072.1 M20/M25/M40 family metallo-hydrolase [Planctomycetota bacterium]MCP4861630.1 M20/M25/M40 family metallo-hydrolase [Planctomycetota bacterium]
MFLPLLLASLLQQGADVLGPPPGTEATAQVPTTESDIAVYTYGTDTALRDQLIRNGEMYDDMGGLIAGRTDTQLAQRLGVPMKVLPALAADEELFTLVAHHDEEEAGPVASSGREIWRSEDGRVRLRALTKAQLATMVNPGFRCHGAVRQIGGNAIKPVSAQSYGGRLNAITPDPVIASWVAQVSDTNIATDIATMEAFGTRRHGQPGSINAQNWLVSEMNGLGLTTTTFSYDSDADVVIGEKQGITDPSKIVIIGAHYDSVNWQGSATSPAPGADDDASGTAGVLEIARILAANDFDYTIRFCAFSGEELGLLGSEAYAAHLDNINANVIGMVQLDMTAYRAPGDTRSVGFITNDTDTNMNNFAMDVYAAYVPTLPINIGPLSGGTSDHRSFFNHGFPAIFPFEDLGQYSPYIHTSSDVTGTSANDFVLAEMITAGALATVAELARPVSMTLSHSPLGNTQDEVGPYVATADVVSQTAASVNTVELNWRLEGGNWNSVAMSPTGTPDQWSGDIPGQVSPARVEYYIVATDTNSRSIWTPEGFAPGDSVHRFVIGIYNRIAFDDFDGASDNGWTHTQVATQDDWQRGTPQGNGGDPGGAYSGANVWANDLGLSGWNGTYATNTNNHLDSPPFDCTGASGVYLRFARWLTVEDGAYDHARIEVNGQTVWSNPTGSDLLDNAWSIQDIDISAIADGNPSVSVRFHLDSDGGLEYGGWNIDDFELYTLEPVGGPGGPTLAAPGSVNAGSAVTIDLSNAPSNSPWWLLYSFSNSGTVISGLSFEIGAPWVLLHNGSADGNGDASYTKTIPPIASGRTVYLEAATSGGTPTTTNMLTLQIL